jgi:hypothetical protein
MATRPPEGLALFPVLIFGLGCTSIHITDRRRAASRRWIRSKKLLIFTDLST